MVTASGRSPSGRAAAADAAEPISVVSSKASIPNAFTVADVLAWARTKPADERYDYSSPWRCAIAQFLVGTGRAESVSVCSNFWGAGRCIPTIEFDSAISDAALDWDRALGWTFGQFADRLEAMLPAPMSDTWAHPDAYLTDIETVDA